MRKALISLSAGLLALAASGDILAGKTYSVQDVKGRYTFSFYGEVSVPSPSGDVSRIGPIAASGYLIADGNGLITEGERTLSTPFGIFHQTFTCTLKVNSKGTGTATCPLDDDEMVRPDGFPVVETFDFAISNNRESFQLVGTTRCKPPGDPDDPDCDFPIAVSVVGNGNR